MDYCDQHINFAENIAQIKEKVFSIDKRINGSIDDITKHIEHGQAWRIAIVGNFVTIFVLVAVQVGIFLFLWGQLTHQVMINTDRITQVENLHPRTP
jgi:hypothetical protein